MKRISLFFFVLCLTPFAVQSMTMDEYLVEAEKAGYTEREALFLFDDVWEAEDGQVWVEKDGEEFDLETLMINPEEIGKKSKRKFKKIKSRSMKSGGSWGLGEGPKQKTKRHQEPTRASQTRSKTRR